MPHLLTYKEVADRLKVCEKLVRRLAADGKIPSIRISRKCTRFDPDAVFAALQETFGQGQ